MASPPPPRSRLCVNPVLLLAAVVLLLPGVAWGAVVESVAVPGFGGEMTELRPGRTTGEAVALTPDGEERPLGPGVELPTDSVVETRRARVVVRLDSDETLHIEEASSVELGAGRTVIQHVGEVYYSVREAFTVEYGTVETAVEGTRFLVVGTTVDGGPVVVSVDEGVVTVRTPAGSQTVRQGETLSASPDAAPSAPEKWSTIDRGRSVGQTLTAGPPRALVGGLLMGGLTGAVGTESLRLSPVGSVSGRLLGSIKLLGPLRATAQAGVGGGRRTVQAPVDAGLELMLGPFAFGGSTAMVWEERAKPCGETQTWLHIGGKATGRVEVPLGRRLRVLGAAQVGAVGTVTADAGVGLGVVL